jgi:hypothetical protein
MEIEIPNAMLQMPPLYMFLSSLAGGAMVVGAVNGIRYAAQSIIDRYKHPELLEISNPGGLESLPLAPGTNTLDTKLD